MLDDKVTSEIVKVFVDDGFAEEASEAGPGVGKDVAVDEPVQPPAELLVLEHVGQHVGLVTQASNIRHNNNSEVILRFQPFMKECIILLS